jgi:hypothetical protein
MKIQVFRNKQFSFLPVSISLNGSSFKPLLADNLAEFDSKSESGNFVLNLYGLKREFVIPFGSQSIVNMEMCFKLDKNQKLLLALSIIGCVFLLFAGFFNKNITQILVGSATFFVIAIYSLQYAMHLELTNKAE